MAHERSSGSWLEFSTPRGARIRILGGAHPRSTRLRLTVSAGGARISYPHGTHPARVSAFLRENADWLERELERLRLSRRGRPAIAVGRETVMLLRGEEVPLTWTQAPYPRVLRDNDAVVLALPRLTPRFLPVARGLLAGYLEERMRRDVARGLAQMVPQLGLAPTGLRIRPMQSQWGSLDTRDRINLDLSLALAPAAALRYVLAHEMAHLKVRDHSARFWKRVGELDPAWESQRTWLREEGAVLKMELERLVADIAD